MSSFRRLNNVPEDPRRGPVGKGQLYQMHIVSIGPQPRRDTLQ
jgi:hypothetical protein